MLRAAVSLVRPHVGATVYGRVSTTLSSNVVASTLVRRCLPTSTSPSTSSVVPLSLFRLMPLHGTATMSSINSSSTRLLSSATASDAVAVGSTKPWSATRLLQQRALPVFEAQRGRFFRTLNVFLLLQAAVGVVFGSYVLLQSLAASELHKTEPGSTTASEPASEAESDAAPARAITLSRTVGQIVGVVITAGTVAMFVLFRMYCRTYPVRMAFALEPKYSQALQQALNTPISVPRFPVALKVDSIGWLGGRVSELFYPDQFLHAHDSGPVWALSFAKLRDEDVRDRPVSETEAGERRGFMVDNRSVTAGTRRAIQRFLAGEALTEQDLLDIFPPGKRAAVLDKFAGAASK